MCPSGLRACASSAGRMRDRGLNTVNRHTARGARAKQVLTKKRKNMKKYLLALIALLAACGAPPEETQQSPAPFVRIDSDGSELATAPYLPDQTYAPEDGVNREEWLSALYHGTSGPNAIVCGTAAGRQCIFPQFKDVHILPPDYASCDALPRADSAVNNRTFLDAAIAGAKKWNGVGGFVGDGSCAGANQCVTFHCEGLTNCDSTGKNCEQGHELDSGGIHFQESDLPGPGGQAVTRSAGEIYISPAGIVAGCSGTTTHTAFAPFVGEHEMGHELGFGHFTSAQDDPMQSICSLATVPIYSGFGTARAELDTSGGNATVVDNTGLGSKGPCGPTTPGCPR
jgi:hypothetical protein